MKPRAVIPIPFDILESIVELIGVDEDTKSLKAVSLACYAMVPLCRKFLFSSVRLSRGDAQKGSLYIGELLSMSPDIAQYVTKLRYLLHDTNDADRMVLDLLKERSSLRSLHLRGEDLSDWLAFPAPVRSAVIYILQSHPIALLDICHIRKFPGTVLSFCKHLTDIQLMWVEMATEEPTHFSNQSRIPTPTGLKNMGGYGALEFLMRITDSRVGPTVDFSQLKDAMLEVEMPADEPIIEGLLEIATQLESLSIILDPIHIRRPLRLISLNTNSLSRLKSAVFEFVIHGNYHDPLCGICDELRKLASKNVLENIEVSVQVQIDSRCRTNSEDWSDLDALLTGPGFPKLRRVKLEFFVFSFQRSQREVQDLLNSMPRERFRKLSESTTIAFEYSAENEYV
ncbi:hypothetical protein GALMADRAFT_256698 [Galerina marginata CBS 339.88]|uniref:F-box domain-containing protein n=1 Tax=Galerina marginata (strain CBS 339.88) TaxID=685588 RepID=A0A067SD22_GALM3|nr:hypothetical protein GALMADRAFT_256698 [Galerina marginata CBS 339.88]